ncbi:MAG: ATP-binding protein [Myxococcota bacterium]|nr:ATP-binding protein [Myxococcota bacterium]
MGIHESQSEPNFPVFGRVYRSLLAGVVLGPAFFAMLCWFLMPTYIEDGWLLGVVAGGLVSIVIALLSWTAARRFERDLSDTVSWVRAANRGALGGRLPILPNDHFVDLKKAVNQMAAQLIVAQEATSDRRFLQAVIDALPEPVVVLDANGVVELANRRFAVVLDFDGTVGPVGRGLGTLAGIELPPWYRKLLDGESGDPFEVQFRSRTGKVIGLKVSGALLRSEEGLPDRVVLQVHDQSELSLLAEQLAAAEATAAESAAVFQNLFDAIEDPITVLDLNGDILQANRAARAMFGRDLLGKKCFRAFRMRDAICDDCPASITYQNRQSTSVEHRIFGNAITRIQTYPLLGKNGEVRAILNHKRDVTKERKLEDLKESFLAAVSHELRTPLTSIIGFNKLNRRRMNRHVAPQLVGAPHKVRVAFQQILDDMEIMVSEGERLGRLVNDILDLSKLEAGKMDLTIAPFDLARVVQGAIAATSALWRPKALVVEADIEVGLPEVLGDADRIAQVLVNLLSNATKFTDEGSIRVSVSADDAEVTTVVADTGQGIPPDQVQRVFEKFRQVEGKSDKQPVGTGLGLPICRELIHLHKGRIWVDSDYGDGARFSFTIPRADARPTIRPSPIQDRTTF